MLQRIDHRYRIYEGPAPDGTLQLERDGYCLLKGVLSADEVAALREAMLQVYRDYPGDLRAGRPSPESAEMFRYEMFNRSALCQEITAHPTILSIVEPLVGDNCHVISSTAWRNPGDVEHAPRGQEWHSDAGPHIPRPPGVPWPDAIPYPVFAIATHVFVEDCGPDDGPTALVPGSHKSGMPPPKDREWDLTLSHEGRDSVECIAEAGDVAMFVSDVWHRRMPPTERCTGRFFLQTNYARRDIAQRVRPTSVVNHTSAEARERARTERERQLLGLHGEMFYDG